MILQNFTFFYLSNWRTSHVEICKTVLIDHVQLKGDPEKKDSSWIKGYLIINDVVNANEWSCKNIN